MDRELEMTEAWCKEPEYQARIATLESENAALRTQLSGRTCFVPPEFQAEMDALRDQVEALKVAQPALEDMIEYAISLQEFESDPIVLGNIKRDLKKAESALAKIKEAS